MGGWKYFGQTNLGLLESLLIFAPECRQSMSETRIFKRIIYEENPFYRRFAEGRLLQPTAGPRGRADDWRTRRSDLRVDFKDGRIVCDGKHSFIWSWEDEDDEIENL